MAEYKYVSLRDVLKDQAIPKLKFREPRVESDEEPDFDLVSKNVRNPKFPSSPPFQLLGSCSDIPDKGKMKKVAEKKNKIKKKGLRARFSSNLKHSRSDDPLVYVECDEDDADAFDDLKTLSQEMKNFSWEERTIKSNILSESEEEEDEKN